ncbi:hypothetical protein F2Q69_00054293 [Brassica cretica]|uniref:Uncharacterized protein n=1 Tax=Brassica cretica TaxID=69181 RepID=A0A8S9MRP6_BRACR|nr:hypothetical protein F2Q69_00054293 [Brassica cretica]
MLDFGVSGREDASDLGVSLQQVALNIGSDFGTSRWEVAPGSNMCVSGRENASDFVRSLWESRSGMCQMSPGTPCGTKKPNRDICVKPDARTYSLLVDAHLINRDPRSAMAVSDDMINAGIEPSKETLENLRRRCLRELDYKKDVQVDSLAKKFEIRMGS